jgi:hypothetical protein
MEPDSRWGTRKPIPSLIQLAELVRERMDARRRAGPKWKFRVEPDLIVQLQPWLPRERTRWGKVIKEPLEFEGLAIEGEGIDAKAFDEPGDNRRIEFHIKSDWTLYRRGYGPYLAPLRETWRPEYPRPLTREQSAEYTAEHEARRAAHTASFAPLWDRIVAALRGDFFTSLRPGALLGSACICCGRPLTDPISQARFIGPECYGSASKDVRWIYVLQPARAVDAAIPDPDELAELEELLR